MDFYAVLGVTEEATPAEVKRAYTRLARRYHPDLNPGDDQAALRFRLIAEAYQTLSDPQTRLGYDGAGPAPTTSAAGAYAFEGFDFSLHATGDRASTFGELFAEAFRGSGGLASERGADVHVTLSLTFEEAMRGAEPRVSVTRRELCRRCGGRGRLQTAEAACRVCAGSGAVRSRRGHMVFVRPCEPCAGTGRVQELNCPSCHGDGTEIRAEGLTCHVPAGVLDGARIRFPGGGNVGRFGGGRGDLQVTIQVTPHRLFRREGNDLHLRVPVAVHEAALGARIDVPSLDGRVRLRVPPGTQNGQRFRLRGRGAPGPRSGERGDLLVEVHLVLPAVLDERSKDLMRELGRAYGEDPRAGLFQTAGL